jgi:hypothetical protein
LPAAPAATAINQDLPAQMLFFGGEVFREEFRDSELARRARIPAESAQAKNQNLENTLATASG